MGVPASPFPGEVGFVMLALAGASAASMKKKTCGMVDAVHQKCRGAFLEKIRETQSS